MTHTRTHGISHDMITHRLVQELNQMVTATFAPTKQQLTPTKQLRSDKSRGHSPPPAGKVYTLVASIYHSLQLPLQDHNQVNNIINSDLIILEY